MITQNSLRFPITLLGLAVASGLTACVHDESSTADESSTIDESSATGPRAAAAPGCGTPGVNCGLTWVKARHLDPLGEDTVSCHDYTSNPSTSCNPYVGDTDCKQERPILCIRQDGSASNGFVGSPPGPPYYYDAYYNGWAKGNIGLTHGIQGTSLTSLAVADAACAAEHGAGWRMAEFHDGDGGWQWTAFGNLNDIYMVNGSGHQLNRRFWVHINDQPAGNCW